MEIKIGKYYRSANGRKVGPMDGDMLKWIEGREISLDPEWDNDGTPRNAAARYIGALIAEWVDEPQIEVGKTYSDRAGRAWECLFIKDAVAFMQFEGKGNVFHYKLDGTPIGLPSNCTIDLSHVRGEVVKYVGATSLLSDGNMSVSTHKITIPTLDGKPAVGTYTGENGLCVKIEEVE